MIFLANVVWLFIFGWWQWLIFMLLSVLFSLTVIFLPLGKSFRELAKLIIMPFGKKLVRDTKKGKYETGFGWVFNVVWFPIGLAMSLWYFVTGFLAFFTIIGIPYGIVCMRVAKFIFLPIGVRVMTDDEYISHKVGQQLEKTQNENIPQNTAVFSAPIETPEIQQPQRIIPPPKIEYTEAEKELLRQKQLELELLQTTQEIENIRRKQELDRLKALQDIEDEKQRKEFEEKMGRYKGEIKAGILKMVQNIQGIFKKYQPVITEKYSQFSKKVKEIDVQKIQNNTTNSLKNNKQTLKKVGKGIVIVGIVGLFAFASFKIGTQIYDKYNHPTRLIYGEKETVPGKDLILVKNVKNTTFILGEAYLFETCNDNPVKLSQIQYYPLVSYTDDIDISKIKILGCKKLFYEDQGYVYTLQVNIESSQNKEIMTMSKDRKLKEVSYDEENKIFTVVGINDDVLFYDENFEVGRFSILQNIGITKEKNFGDTIPNLLKIIVNGETNFIDTKGNLLFGTYDNLFGTNDTWMSEYMKIGNLDTNNAFFIGKIKGKKSLYVIDTKNGIPLANEPVNFREIHDGFFFVLSESGKSFVYDYINGTILKEADNMIDVMVINKYLLFTTQQGLYGINSERKVERIEDKNSTLRITGIRDIGGSYEYTEGSDYRSNLKSLDYEYLRFVSQQPQIIKKLDISKIPVRVISEDGKRHSFLFDTDKKEFLTVLEDKTYKGYKFGYYYINTTMINAKSVKNSEIPNVEKYEFTKYKDIEGVLAIFRGDGIKTDMYDKNGEVVGTCKNVKGKTVKTTKECRFLFGCKDITNVIVDYYCEDDNGNRVVSFPSYQQ